MKKFIKKLWQIFTNKWVITILGIIAIVSLVWFGGPLLAIAGKEPLATQESRLILLCSLFMIFGIYNFWLRYKTNKKNEIIMSELERNSDDVVVDPGDQLESDEVNVLKDNMHQALNTLRSTRLHSKNLYELPWYMMIGPPGSGKTTVLLNSGLQFPLQKKLGSEVVKGIGGTRYCDWWFTDQAVLIDTAGRYTSQDSHERVDSSGWKGFLGLLKEHRPRRPINGVLVVISVHDVALRTKDENNNDAKAIRERIQELYSQLGIEVPVYVVLSKMDLLPGFTQTFEGLSKEEREQVWGTTFPINLKTEETNSPVGVFNKEFSLLVDRLTERTNALMLKENNLDMRSKVFDFPIQLKSIQNNLNEFLTDIFSTNRYENGPLLRGVYLTSATQTGSPIDRITMRLAQGFGMKPNAPEKHKGVAKGYFVKRLFNEVIFAESDLAGTNRKYDLRQNIVKIITYAVSVAVLICCASLWANSYYKNIDFIADIESNLAEYRTLTAGGITAQTDVQVLNKGLNKLRQFSGEYTKEIAKPSWQMGFGLYQGDKLGSQATIAYDKANRQYFAPYIKELLERQIRSSGENYDLLFESLKVYLMLYNQDKRDVELLKTWLQITWKQEFIIEDKDILINDLAKHFDALLESNASFPKRNEELVLDARSKLSSMSLSELVYRRLKQESADTGTPKDFRISDILSSRSQQIFVKKSGQPLNQKIPKLFTHAGFYSIFQLQSSRLAALLSSEYWIVSDEKEVKELTPIEIAKLKKDVEDIYFDEYIHTWRSFINDINIKPFSTAAEGSSILSVLTGPEKPLYGLFNGVKKQVMLTKVPGADKLEMAADIKDGMPTTRLENKIDSKTARLERLIPDNLDTSGLISLPGSRVEEAFKDIIEFVGQDDETTAPINSINDAIAELRGYLEGLENAGNPEAQALANQKNFAQSGAALNKMEQYADLTPKPVDGWLNQMAKQSTNLTSSGAIEYLNDLWTTDVYQEYQASIAGKYPFNASAEVEVTLEDFGRFFGYGGVLDSFFEEHLKQLVDTSSTPWTFNRSIGAKKGALSQFYMAKKIRQTFFKPGSQVPEIRFTLKPVTMEKTAGSMTLLIDSQKIDYQHGPAKAVNLSWPGESAIGQARLSFTAIDGSASDSVTLEGPWSWFRLIDKGSVASTSGYNRFTVNLNALQSSAQFELRANSVKNPFDLPEIKAFKVRSTL